MCIYNSFETDPLRQNINKLSDEHNNNKNIPTYAFKPDFKKVSQVNWFEMTEIEEQDSSFSSVNDNHSISRNIK